MLLLPFVTLGISSLVWFVKTKNEMKNLGPDIPTAPALPGKECGSIGAPSGEGLEPRPGARAAAV